MYRKQPSDSRPRVYKLSKTAGSPGAFLFWLLVRKGNHFYVGLPEKWLAHWAEVPDEFHLL
jgi:hypothetical protein